LTAGKELKHGIGPIDMPIDRILTRKHALRESRADDHHRLLILVIERVEIAPGNNGNAQRGEKAGRDVTPQRARVVFAMDVTITRELQTYTEAAVGITPGSDHSESRLGYTGQRIDATHRFFVEIEDLLRRFSVVQRWNVDDEDLTRINARLGSLQRGQRSDQHACARQQHERRCNLRDCKGPLAASGAAGDAN